LKRACTAPVLFAPAQVALAASTTQTFAGSDHRGPVARAIEVFAVASRACTAAHYYEELIRLSDDELALRGLRRADVPRAAFHVLAADRRA
jgi:hypothetical protein